jgi:hypothetical protein
MMMMITARESRGSSRDDDVKTGFTDDDGFTLACTTITSRSRSRYL